MGDVVRPSRAEGKATDPGWSFDRHLPARLKPVQPPAAGARPRRCDPLDPLCDDP
jgi:hypothetical protein